MLVLGILVPWYVRKETERKEQMKLKEKLKDFISSLNTVDKIEILLATKKLFRRLA